MAIPWGAIINGVVSIVGSIIGNKSKSDAKKVSDKMSEGVTAQADMEAGMRNSGYVKGSNGVWVRPTPLAPDINAEHTALKNKNKKSRFGGDALTPEEKTQLKGYENMNAPIMDAVMQSKNPVTAPDGGFGDGGGSNYNPFDATGGEEIIISGKKKTAGMSPWLIIGILGAGGGLIYSQRKKGGGRRRR